MQDHDEPNLTPSPEITPLETGAQPSSEGGAELSSSETSPQITSPTPRASLASRMRSSPLMQRFESQLEKLEPLRLAESLSTALQGKGISYLGTGLTILLCSWFLADVAGLVAGKYIPEPKVTQSFGNRGQIRRSRSIDEYQVISSRNLFNSAGRIPGEEVAPGTPVDPGGAPIKTSLPFNLIGTLILRNELQSIATIEDKSASMVYPVRVDDEIPSKAKIIKIESHKVIFFNPSSGRREYIDIPEDLTQGAKIQLQSSLPSAPSLKSQPGAGVERVSTGQFNIARAEVEKTLSDLNNVLTQARAVPNFENGVPAGYKLFQIVPGSIYEKLGLQNGDVISGLNGQPINDPGKAFELLSELKTASHLELQVKKDGKVQNYSYDIR